jgi:nitroimidazol reductase NimA-like FMN-containing flavoprotein (pyridoxamine 5'-phosphate oxidase superfamily)
MADNGNHSMRTPAEQDRRGSAASSAPPRSEVNARRVLERLSDAECMDLLSAGTIARLVYTSQYGPVALPFEYRMYQGSIVFRTYRATFTEEDLRTDIEHADYGVAVEIDRTDPERREGWTVIVRGPAHHMDSEAERSAIAEVDLESWIEGEPEHFIRVTPTSVQGIRIRPT